MDNPLPQGAQAVELLSPETQHWRAERELADALSTFQAQVQPATELTLLAVVEAAKPAFQLGFCFSVRSTDEGTAVLMMHRSGAQQSAESEAYDEDFRLSARLWPACWVFPWALYPGPARPSQRRVLMLVPRQRQLQLRYLRRSRLAAATRSQPMACWRPILPMIQASNPSLPIRSAR